MAKHHLIDYPSVRTVQKDNELLWFISELLAHDVKSLLSIGLLDGGTEWHIARIYREFGRKINITGIDIDATEELKKHIGEITTNFGQSFSFLQGNSHAFELKKKYDAVWIDGDHSYCGAKMDFELALRVANKLIAMHDIVESEYHRKQKCFVARLWNEIKEEGYRTLDVAGKDWGGIGIVYLD